MVQIKDRKNVPSEEDFLKAVEENENQKPKLPKYLTAIYGKIYENPKISRLLDSPRLLNIFTLGNSSRLIEASLKEVKQSQKVLQIGATFGDQIEQTADRIGYYGKYDLIDVSETQLTRVEEKYKYLSNIYTTLIVRDITQKYKIRNTKLLEDLNNFLMDNISNLISSRKIAKELSKDRKNQKEKSVSDKTVNLYLKYLCSAFAFYKVRRYDIQGKKYLSSQDKYYLVDSSFKYAITGTKNMNYGRIYENIVALELLRRGYELYVGILYHKEIDFVAIKKDEKIYIQVSDDISDDKTFDREVTPLLQIKDAYPKMLIARTKHDNYQYEGVQIVDIAKWLLE